MQIFIIRHGLSEGNASGVMQGHTDSPLAETGVYQAELLGRYFEREGIIPDKIFSSPLARAYQTAELIAGAFDLQPAVITVQGLMEVDIGGLSGKSIKEVHSTDRWETDVNRWLDFSQAGGESFDEFFERVTAAVKNIMEGWDLLADRTVFFVTHAGTMRPLLQTLLDARSDFMYFTFGNCCHVKVEYRPVRDSIRRVLSELMRIEKVAELMGEADPSAGFDDPVGKKIG